MPRPVNPRNQPQSREWIKEFKSPTESESESASPVASPSFLLPVRKMSVPDADEVQECRNVLDLVPSIEVTPAKVTQEANSEIRFFPPMDETSHSADGLADAESLAAGWQSRAVEEARPPSPVEDHQNPASTFRFPPRRPSLSRGFQTTPAPDRTRPPVLRTTRTTPVPPRTLTRTLTSLPHGYTPVSARPTEYESFPTFTARSKSPGGAHRRAESITNLLSNPNEVSVGRVVQFMPDLEAQTRPGYHRRGSSLLSGLSGIWGR